MAKSNFITFLADRRNRQWLLKILVIILVFLLLAWAVWLFFDKKLEQTKPRYQVNGLETKTTVYERN